jgi:hypothetical protein
VAKRFGKRAKSCTQRHHRVDRYTLETSEAVKLMARPEIIADTGFSWTLPAFTWQEKYYREII